MPILSRRTSRSAARVLLAALLPVGAADLAAQTCRLVADLHPGASPSSPTELRCVFGDTLFFSANDGRTGHEPWISKAGGKPVLLADLRASGGSSPREFVACGSVVFFTADDGRNGRELWATDGTRAGTRLVKDIRPGRFGSDPRELACVGERVVFRADDGVHGGELWASDGTSAGTVLLGDLRPGATGSFPQGITTCGRRAYFSADDGKVGRELWATDGTPAGTVFLKDVNPGVNHGNPSNLFCHRGTLFFAARAGRRGVELFQSDGTVKGTALVKDINPSGDSLPHSFTSCGAKLFFVASAPPFGTELFVHDGNGTRMVRDVQAPGSSSPKSLVCAGGVLFFSAATSTAGRELWKSDGTTAGTTLVKDVRAGAASSSPAEMAAVGGRIYFQAHDGKSVGLWTSDGTGAGTRRLCTALQSPRHLVLCGCKLLFSAFETRTSHELYAIDAPGASVTSFAPSCAPQGATLEATPPVIGRTLTFSGRRGPGASMAFLLLDVAPRPRLRLPNGCFAHVSPLAVVTIGAAPVWRLGLPVPNDPSFDGACLAAQAVWISAGTVFPIHTTNALLLGFGR